MRTIIGLLLFSCAAVAANAPAVTNIAAVHHDGQTFITWADAGVTGAGGANYRYEVYRSTVAITSAAGLTTALSNGTATFAQETLNNSGQIQAPASTWNQAARQNTALPMSVIVQALDANGKPACGSTGAWTACGTQLAPLTGLAVHTATVDAPTVYWVVITHDRTGAETDSLVSAGGNATVTPIAEAVGALAPIKLFDSHDTVNRNAGTGAVTITGATGIPLWIQLAGSPECTIYNAGTLAFGDLWQFYSDTTMGYREGMPFMFAVQEDHNGATFGSRSLYSNFCDNVWLPTGVASPGFNLTSIEPIYSGYLWPNATTYQRYNEVALTYYTNWVAARYGADTNRIYQTGQSAGGYAADWAVRHPEIFAAVFPSSIQWKRTVAVNAVTGVGAAAPAAGTIVADTGELFTTHFDMPAYVAAHCGDKLPAIITTVSRNDTSRPNFSMWTGFVATINALKGCHALFSAGWTNGGHGDENTPGSAMPTLKLQYQLKYAKNVSAPAFANSSIDDNIGDGTNTNGSCNTGTAAPYAKCYINAGFSWSAPTETATTWTSAISNSLNSAPMTVDISPRNVQSFITPAGRTVTWTSTGANQSGSVTVDSWGVATATGITIPAGATTTVTFTLQPAAPATPPTPANSITLRNSTGGTVTNYPLQFARPFVRGEIQHYPQMGICTDSTCTAVNSWITTQADRKTQWDDGSSKHVILSTLLASLPAGLSYFTFRDQVGCNCGTGLTRAEMLAAGYNFDANIIAVQSGLTKGTGARQMITDWDGSSTSPVKYWLAGTVATEVILADQTSTHAYDFGWQPDHVMTLTDTLLRTDTSATVDSTAGLTAPFYARIYRPKTSTAGLASWNIPEDVHVCSLTPTSITFGNLGCTDTLGRGQRSTVAHQFLITDQIHADTAWADAATAPFKSNRPIYYATFWPTINKVYVRAVNDLVDTEKLQDQIFDLTITLGNTSPSTLYAKTAHLQRYATRFTKTGWIGAVPPTIDIIHGMAYLSSTQLLQNWDPAIVPNDAAAQLTIYNNLPHADCGDSGGILQRVMSTTGANQSIAPESEYFVKWLLTGNDQYRTILMGNADLALCGWPMNLREGNTAKKLDRALAVSGFGLPVTVSDHKSWCWHPSCGFNYVSTVAGDRIGPIGSYSMAGIWNIDTEHFPNLFWPPYIMTGDPFHLENAQMWVGTECGYSQGASHDAGSRGPTGAECFKPNNLRGAAWPMRQVVEAAAWTPDAAVDQKAHYTMLAGDTVAPLEGVLGLPNSYPLNAAYSTMYNFGATTMRTSNLFWRNGGPSPLHLLRLSQGTGFAQCGYGVDTSTTSEAISNYEHNYLIVALGISKDIGPFPKAANALLGWVSKFFYDGISNPNFNKFLLGGGRMPTVNKDGTLITTYANLQTGFRPTNAACPPSDPGTPGFYQSMTGWNTIGQGESYPGYTIASLALLADQPNGDVLWNFASQQRALFRVGSPDMVNSPAWIIIPRGVVVAPPVLLPTLTTTGPVTFKGNVKVQF